MSLNDPLANVLSQIRTADKKGIPTVNTRNVSKTIKAVLTLLQTNNYLGEFKHLESSNGGTLEISLLGSINDVGVIKPRHSVKLQEYKKYEERYLPAFGFGFLVVSTHKGIMTHEDAIKNQLGGKLMAFVY